MLAGYHRRTNPQGIYFRELYALLYNINRGEKTPAIDSLDVLQLPGEKRKRGQSGPKLKKRSAEELADLVSRIAKS